MRDELFCRLDTLHQFCLSSDLDLRRASPISTAQSLTANQLRRPNPTHGTLCVNAQVREEQRRVKPNPEPLLTGEQLAEMARASPPSPLTSFAPGTFCTPGPSC